MSPARLAISSLVLSTLILSACGSSNPDDRGGSAPSGDSRRDAFPITIDHRHGRTEIAAPPERVVTVGLTDHDAFLALGVVPVGVTDWYGDHPSATWPWARDELGGARPQIVGDATQLNFEAIAALEPDVIEGLYSALDEKTYETLSKIAPVVAQPDSHVDYGVPWQELTLTVGRIIGREDRAGQLVAAVEERVAEIRRDHPEFVGASVALAAPFEGIYVYSPKVANGRLITSLGFEIPGEIASLVGDSDGANLSIERVDLLDVDVMIWIDGVAGEGPLDEPVYQELSVHEQGREVLLASTGDLGAASFVSVLSIPFLLDDLVPMLANAVDGDPGTVVPDDV